MDHPGKMALGILISVAVIFGGGVWLGWELKSDGVRQQETVAQQGQAEERDFYLGQPKGYSSLPSGDYAVKVVLENGRAVVVQSLPTSDMTIFINGLPSSLGAGDKFTIKSE